MKSSSIFVWKMESKTKRCKLSGSVNDEIFELKNALSLITISVFGNDTLHKLWQYPKVTASILVRFEFERFTLTSPEFWKAWGFIYSSVLGAQIFFRFLQL